MSKRAMFEIGKRIRDAAGRAYIEQQTMKRTRVIRRETDEEVRAVLREVMEVQRGMD